MSGYYYGQVASTSPSPQVRQRRLLTRLCRCEGEDERLYSSENWGSSRWGILDGRGNAAPRVEASVVDGATGYVIVDGITVLPSNHDSCASRRMRDRFVEALASIFDGFRALFSFGNGDNASRRRISTIEKEDNADELVHWIDVLAPKDEFVVSECPSELLTIGNTSTQTGSMPQAETYTGDVVSGNSTFGIIEPPSGNSSNSVSSPDPTSSPTFLVKVDSLAPSLALSIHPSHQEAILALPEPLVFSDQPTATPTLFSPPTATPTLFSPPTAAPTLSPRPTTRPSRTPFSCPVEAVGLKTGDGQERFVSSILVELDAVYSSPSPWTCEDPWNGEAQNLPTTAMWFAVNGTGGWFEANTCSSTVQHKMHLIQGDCLEWQCVTGGQPHCNLGATLTWLSQPGQQYWILVHVANGDFDGAVGFNLRSPGVETDPKVLLNAGERGSSTPTTAAAPSEHLSPSPQQHVSRPTLQDLLPSLAPPSPTSNVFYREKNPSSHSNFSEFVVASRADP